jgi:predicted alpha/beta-hydrolase family hydrolase
MELRNDYQDIKFIATRADHLADLQVPMLFLTGSRDDWADLSLLQGVSKNLGKRTTLHVLDTADHIYKILKKSRTQSEDVFAEMARVRAWVD